jgi:hypothetical protein
VTIRAGAQPLRKCSMPMVNGSDVWPCLWSLPTYRTFDIAVDSSSESQDIGCYVESQYAALQAFPGRAHSQILLATRGLVGDAEISRYPDKSDPPVTPTDRALDSRGLPHPSERIPIYEAAAMRPRTTGRARSRRPSMRHLSMRPRVLTADSTA